jgi:hypothetical protein
MKRGSEHPFRDAIKSLSRLPIPRLVAGNLLFCGVAVFYGTFTSIKTLLPALIPFNFDVTLAGWDDALHAGVAPWRLFHPILGNYIATRMIEILYGSVWIMLLFAVPAIFAMHPKLAHLRQRFFMTFFLVWIGLGNVLAAWGMSAGPAFYGAITGDATRYADLLSLLSATRGSLQSAADYQDYLWSSYVTGKLHFGTGISAFPSMHVALATLYTLAAVAVDKWLGAVFVLFWAIILVGSVHLAWHYAIDGYVSTLGTIVIWLAVSGCQALAGRIRSTASRPLIPQGA